MIRKEYLMTPGPTPIPYQVSLAQAEPMIHHRTPVHYVDQPPWQLRTAGARHEPDRHDRRFAKSRRNVDQFWDLALEQSREEFFLPWEGRLPIVKAQSFLEQVPMVRR